MRIAQVSFVRVYFARTLFSTDFSRPGMIIGHGLRNNSILNIIVRLDTNEVAPADNFKTSRADKAVKLRMATRDALAVQPLTVMNVLRNVVNEYGDNPALGRCGSRVFSYNAMFFNV